MKLVVLGMFAIAACGFNPSGAPVDAHAHAGSDATTAGPDAHVGSPDAHEFHDAMPNTFDVTQCPTGYTNNTIASSPNSRYRVISTLQHLADHLPLCDADHPGWTHLIVPNTLQEAQEVTAVMNSNIFYVGAVQPKNMAAVDAGWVLYTGEPVPDAVWGAGQPNDNNDNFENNEQNFAAIDNAGGKVNDVNPTFSYMAVCECDGKPIPQTVASVIAQ